MNFCIGVPAYVVFLLSRITTKFRMWTNFLLKVKSYLGPSQNTRNSFCSGKKNATFFFWDIDERTKSLKTHIHN